MIIIILWQMYLCIFCVILGAFPIEWEERPTLTLGFGESPLKDKKGAKSAIRAIAVFNKPLCVGSLRRRLARDLSIAHVNLNPEEFFLIKEALFVLSLILTFPYISPDGLFIWLFLCLAGSYYAPELWLKSKIRQVKQVIIKELPDAIDLLGLCVNAGLDFMLALKWVVDKSPPSVMVNELNNLLQEINVGKTRREAIRDLAKRYELPDLSTFARTLIQADKMGTSMTEALNILSDDMRIARYRRGEQLALKAPLKMLIPLLLFIFPVVAILVAGPIMLDFVENNPFKNMAGGP